jgi:pimeloyl-ACP methyl ester carboxylesterase
MNSFKIDIPQPVFEDLRTRIAQSWPNLFFESYKIIMPLVDPESHSGDPADAFDVVVPSLPGFGFSERPTARGFIRVDNIWRKLMTDVLGYPRFVAHGTDVGARVTSALGRFQGDVVPAIHIASVDLDWPEPLPQDLTPAEHDYINRVESWEKGMGRTGKFSPRGNKPLLMVSMTPLLGWPLGLRKNIASGVTAMGIADFLSGIP